MTDDISEDIIQMLEDRIQALRSDRNRLFKENKELRRRLGDPSDDVALRATISALDNALRYAARIEDSNVREIIKARTSYVLDSAKGYMR